jgi:hypothetical protein
MRVWGLLVVLVLLGGCAPGGVVVRSHGDAGAFVNFGSVLFAGDYHPREPGRELRFVGVDGERWLLVEGGAVLFEGRPYRHLVLRRLRDGFERVWFHSVDEGGVWLRRVDVGDRVMVFEPMLLDLLPEGRLVEGVRWGGESVALEYRRVGESLELVGEVRVAYVNVVSDARWVLVGGERVRVFVVSGELFVSGGDVIERSGGVSWFVPFVGVVRFDDGVSLVGVSFQ